MTIKDIIENENMHEYKLNGKYVYCSLWHNRKIHWFRGISLTLKYLADNRYTFKEAMYLSNKPKYNCLSKIFMWNVAITNKYRMINFNKEVGYGLHGFRRGLHE